jgi:hypothetical protein
MISIKLGGAVALPPCEDRITANISEEISE